MSAVTTVAEVAFVPAMAVPAPSDWVDVTPYCRGIVGRRGRDHELVRTQAGESTIRLKNTDRRFDPTNTAGPYYPNILPMARLRVRAVYQGTSHSLFTGYVEDWGQTWSPRPINSYGDAECVVRAVDGFKLLSLLDLSTYSSLVAAASPLAWWKLNEAAGPTIADSGSSPAPGVAVGNLAYQQMDRYGKARAIGFDGSSYITVAAPPALQAPGDLTVEFLALVTGGGLFSSYVFGTTGGNDAVVAVNASGTQLFWGYRGGSVALVPPTIDSWHHYACVSKGTQLYLYQDGVLLGTGRNYGWLPTATPTDAYIGQSGLKGYLEHIAVYSYAMSPTEIAAHSAAAVEVLSGTTSQQITDLLTAIGWPSALASIDPAGSPAQDFDPAGSNALDALSRLAFDTEDGLMFVTPDGVLKFVSRQGVQTAINQVAIFGDAAGEMNYADLLMRYDDVDLYTSVTVTRDGGAPQTSADPAAQAAYGLRSLAVSTLQPSDNDAAGRADGLLFERKTPAVRIETLRSRSGS